MLPVTDLAWAAGFIDGEGWIGVTLRKDHHLKRYEAKIRPGVGGRPRSNGQSVRCEIHVTNRNPIPIARLKEMFPVAKVITTHRKGRKEDYFKWSVTAYKIIPVLRALLPFFVGKQDVAIAALEFQSWYDATSPVPGKTMPVERMERAIGFVIENKQLNGRYSNHPRRLAA